LRSLIRKSIGKATSKSPSVSEHAGKTQPLLNRIIQQLNETDSDFQEKYLLFKTAYSKAPLSPFAFKTQSEWEKAQKQSFDRFKDGFVTYQGELVKSHGEKAIANWLYSLYFPDINLYLEHYAVDQNGKPPAHFGQKYLDEMKWKSETHQKYKTDLISTTFHEFITGSMFKKLEYELQTRGQIFQPRSLNDINTKAFSIYEQNADDLYGSFLSHYKSNQASVIKLLENPSLTLRQSLFLELFSKVYAKYEGV